MQNQTDRNPELLDTTGVWRFLVVSVIMGGDGGDGGDLDDKTLNEFEVTEDTN